MSSPLEMKQTRARWMPALAVLAMSLALVNCGDDPDETPPDTDGRGEPRCAPAPVRCSEESIDGLDLLTTVSTGAIQEEGTTAGEFHTYVDARAGGSPQTQSYTYARFTAQGLVQVPVDDQAALASMEWDIAFRRYILRVNSGVSGPSCTLVARTPEGTAFESVTAVNSAWEFTPEGYFDEACGLVTHEQGLGPATALGGFWVYEACLVMTGEVFVVRLADGRHVKLEVTHYYDAEPQAVCNETGSAPAPNGAAQLRVRWAFLP
ncbi:HmuY family protein [Stigmatella erecta]|uniref:HmuY protein n=1 Tax=Stigmatella erecta TaxID=83460 RepID=A0A1I0K7H3_9BACT|nr:HmuY family protein [Stigmatella erecta]SEU19135.1 HmuY protein [Stigmatella erecta]